ncbi:MAG: GNAT family N-acetyltransferase [Turneriella sp.]|nr:GNAT family N-acetyltransferase [Turneriella sp.]
MEENKLHTKFEHNIVLRNMRMGDYDALREMALLIYPQMAPWRKDQIESLLARFGEGQFVIEIDGKVVASCCSMIVSMDIYTAGLSWMEITAGGMITNHDPEGDTLYGIDIMVHPEYRGMKLARRLYNARKELVIRLNLMRIVIGGRLPGYHKHAEKMTAREYVERVMKKELYDQTLTPQIQNGFVLKRIIKNYGPEDHESVGYATFLEWTNIDYQPNESKRYVASHSVRICAVQYQMRAIKSYEEFAAHCEYFVDVASDYRADFILFPEMLTLQLLSFMPRERPGLAARHLSEFTPKYLETFSGLAAKYNINIIGGSHFTVENEELYNIAYLFHRNGKIDKQYKLHITPSERKWWGVQPGRAIEVFDTDKGKIAIQICYDVEFPELSRIAAQKGAQIIFVPFCTDERNAYLRVRYCAQARCIENQLFLAMAGNVGNLPFVDNIDIQYAQSAILTPSDVMFSRDAVAGECTPNVEMVTIHDVDLETLRRARQSGSVLNWQDRRSDIYEVVSKV